MVARRVGALHLLQVRFVKALSNEVVTWAPQELQGSLAMSEHVSVALPHGSLQCGCCAGCLRFGAFCRGQHKAVARIALVMPLPLLFASVASERLGFLGGAARTNVAA